MLSSRHHWVEKVQVGLATALSLAVMYYLVWPMLRPWDPDGAVVFLPAKEYGRLAIFAGTVWAMAGICALLTLRARPEGALLATLVGAGAVSLHSGNARLLLMRYEHHLGDLLRPLTLELVALAGVLAGAVLVIHVVRWAVRKISPAWVRSDAPPASQTQTKADPSSPAGVKRAGGPSFAVRLVTSLAAGGLTLLLGMLLGSVIFFSADRGQILFALAVSFFLASAAASYFFPSTLSAPCWLAPILLGVAMYLKQYALGGLDTLNWTQVDLWVHALPVDWLTAGCGGAVGGYWLSRRLLDMKEMSKGAPVPEVEE